MEGVHNIHEACEGEAAKRPGVDWLQERADRADDISRQLLHNVQTLSKVRDQSPQHRVYPVTPSELDRLMYERLQQMQDLQHQHFEVKSEYYREEVCRLAVAGKQKSHRLELRQIDELVTPQEKLQCYVNAYQIIVDAIFVYAKPGIAPGADDINPLIIYATLKAQPARVFTTLKYGPLIYLQLHRSLPRQQHFQGL